MCMFSEYFYKKGNNTDILENQVFEVCQKIHGLYLVIKLRQQFGNKLKKIWEKNYIKCP